MVLQSIALAIGLFVTFFEIKTEDLDSLLSNMAKGNSAVAAPTLPTPQEPKAIEQTKTVTTSPQEPKLPEPSVKPTVRTVEPKLPEPSVKPAVSTEEPKLPETKKPEPKVVTLPEAKPIQPHVTVPHLPVPHIGPVVPHPTSIEQHSVTTTQPVVEQATVEESDDVSSQGLDTLNIDSGGNWLEKRIWYKKAEQAYEEIHNAVQKTSDIRSKFVHEVSVIGKHIDDFYEKVSFERGQIDELLQAALGGLATEQKVRGGDLSSDERSIKEKIHADQQAFQSIEITMKAITDLDEQVSKTMVKAFQEIDACNALETKAWNNFKEIGMTLDDKKARVLYYEIENYYKNVEKKIDYLKTNLLSYLQNQLNSKITEQTNKIQATVNSLKSKGLDLENLLKKDTTGDFVVFKQREQMQVKEQAKELAKTEEKAKNTEYKKEIKKLQEEEITWYQKAWCKALEYLCPVLLKLSEWTSILMCCIQTLLCKIKDLICKLFGY